MGKKQTKKLLKKMAKQKGLAKPSKGNKVSKKSGEKSQPKLETLVGRQGQAIRKRQREKIEKNYSKKGDEEEEKTKQVLFDVESGTAKGVPKKKKDEHLGDMSMDDFLAGGFETLAEIKDDDDDDDDDAGQLESDEEDEQEDEQEDEEDDDEDEGEMEEMKSAMQGLKEKDPEFFAHLQKEGKGLLEFGEDEDEEDDDEEAEKEKDQVDENKYTKSMVLDLKKELNTKPTRKTIVLWVKLFRAASVQETNEVMDADEKSESKYRFASEYVRDMVVQITLSDLYEGVQKVLDLKPEQSPKTSRRWGTMEKPVTAFLVDLNLVLKKATSPAFTRDVLKCGRDFTVYFGAVSKKVALKYIKFLVAMWGYKDTNKVIRLSAFSNLQALAQRLKTMLPMILKSSYLEFVRGAQAATKREVARRSMQARCIVELCGIDLSVAYQLAFVYIRQLALHLRAAIVSKSNESSDSVLSWKYLHCLRLWTVVLSSYPGQPEADEKKTNLTLDMQQLRSLIYPLTQVIIGVVNLVPSPKYWPIRLHCVAMLNSLSKASRNYIPVTTLLLDILAAPEFQKKPSPSTATPPLLDELLKFSKTELSTLPVQQAVIDRTFELMGSYLVDMRQTIGFPEMAFPVTVALRAYSKKVQASKLRQPARTMIQKIEQWSAAIKKQRSKVEFTPGAIKRLHHFMFEDDEVREIAQQKQTLEEEEEEEEEEECEEDDEEEEEEEVEEQEESPRPTKKKKMDHVEETEEDIVQDFELSSSDDDDDDDE